MQQQKTADAYGQQHYRASENTQEPGANTALLFAQMAGRKLMAQKFDCLISTNFSEAELGQRFF